MFLAQLLHARRNAVHELLRQGEVVGRVGLGRDDFGEGEGGVVADGCIEGDGLVALTAPPIPVAVAGEIRGDLVKPRRKGGIAAEIAQPAVRADEGVLRDFLGVLRVAEELVNHRVDAAPVSAHHLVKRSRVPVLETGDEQLVEGGFVEFGRHDILRLWIRGWGNCSRISPAARRMGGGGGGWLTKGGHGWCGENEAPAAWRNGRTQGAPGRKLLPTARANPIQSPPRLGGR